MNTLYEKAVKLLVSDIQDKVLKEKIGALGKKAEMEINEPLKNNIFYSNKHFNDRLTNTSIPFTRRERRKFNAELRRDRNIMIKTF